MNGLLRLWKTKSVNAHSGSSGLACLLSVVALLSTACSGGTSSGGSGTTTRPEGSEAAYFSPVVYTTGTLVNLQAMTQFQRYNDYDLAAETNTSCTSGTPCKVGLVSKSNFPIRRAEFVVRNASGSVIQAGETQNDGTASFTIPRVAGNYTLSVHSRAHNTDVRASVLNNPYDKSYYAATLSFSLTGSESNGASVGTVTASATGDALGGAFNIFNGVLLANEFLRARVVTNNSSGTADYCPSSICTTNFSVAPKVQVYWTRGLTPGTYFGDSTSPISFYVPSSGGGIYQGLYILGGIEGDVCTDTDHFDNSVILHEYGHFLEHQYAISDSPGGSHNGNRVIDPRLAWSEGWANFFQAAVLGRSVYRDTTRNSDCPATGTMGNVYTARLSFTDFNMEAMSSGQDSVASSSIRIGEGNFREISISRMLYDSMTGPSQANTALQNDADATRADLGFAMVWSAFRGLGSTSLAGRSVGHFHQQMTTFLTPLGLLNQWYDSTYTVLTAPALTAPLAREKQRPDLRDYGLTLNPTAGSCPSNSYSYASGWTVPDWLFLETETVKDQTDSAGSITWSDQFNTNDMYVYNYDGTSGRAQIRLWYKKWVNASGSGPTNPYDLDLYIYSKDYTFLNSSDIVRLSEDVYPEPSTPSNANGYTGYETVNLSGLPAGKYFINVKAYFLGSMSRQADTQYRLTLGNGENLCP